MTSNPHFASALSWAAAEAVLAFRPRQPTDTAGHDLRELRIHVRDHKMRDLSVADRTLEAHYGAFVVTQSRRSAREASRLALAVAYGPQAYEARIVGREARVYELGPDPSPDDIDGRSPAVVTWADAEMFYLIASSNMSVDALIPIAVSLYEKAR